MSSYFNTIHSCQCLKTPLLTTVNIRLRHIAMLDKAKCSRIAVKLAYFVSSLYQKLDSSFSILDFTLCPLDSAFWLDFTLKLYSAKRLDLYAPDPIGWGH